MTAVDQQQMLAALMLLVMTLLVASGYPPVARWRRGLRIAAMALFVVALAIALMEIAAWWGKVG